MSVWYMDIDTDVKFKAGGVDQKVSTRLDPWVFYCSPQAIGSKFFCKLANGWPVHCLVTPCLPQASVINSGSHFRPLAQQVVIHVEQERTSSPSPKRAFRDWMVRSSS